MEEMDALSLESLEGITGGLTSEEQIRFVSVKCPVAGCGFTCSSFGELNIHMRECHKNNANNAK